jgi:hypothetical protein
MGERRRGISGTAIGHQLGTSGGATPSPWEALLFRHRQDSTARTARREHGPHNRVVKIPGLTPIARPSVRSFVGLRADTVFSMRHGFYIFFLLSFLINFLTNFNRCIKFLLIWQSN